MIKTEYKEVIKKTYDYIPVSGKCDVCGKELLPVNKDQLPGHCKETEIYDYYRITTHHHDWGNDSIDSYEYVDCCCLDCALKFVAHYWDGCTRTVPWPTLELEMKHEYRLRYHD